MTSHFSSYKAICLLTLLLIFGFGRSISAKKYPIPKPADVETLKGTKSGSGVQLNWTDGVSPFDVLRNDQAAFDGSASLSILATAQSPSNYLDAAALTDGISHFYLVSDSNAPPAVYTITSSNLTIGDTATMQGRGLSGAFIHDAGFNNITLSGSSSTQLTFLVPAKGLVSGPIAVERAGGGGFFTDIVTFNLHKVGVSGFTTPGHVTFDPNIAPSGRVFYADINQPTSKIWQFDPATGTVSAFGTVWPTRPYGLSLGNWLGSGDYIFATGQVPTSSNSPGNVFRYDTGTGVRTLVGPLSPSGTGDPVDPRALAIGPDPYLFGSATSVYGLTMPNSFIGSYIRFLKNDGTLPSRTDWTPVSISGGTTQVNAPGGTVVTGASSVYFTDGQGTSPIRSRVQYWSANNATPPVRTQQFLSDSGNFFITNAAQLAKDQPNPLDPFSVWIADRGNPTAVPPIPGSIEKLNIVDSSSVLRFNKRSVKFYADANKTYVSEAKGISVQYANAIQQSGSPGKYSYMLWVTNDQGFRMYRALRQIKVKVWIAQSAGLPFGAGLPGVFNFQIIDWINNSIKFANLSFNEIGLNLQLDPVIGSVNDDTSMGKQYRVPLLKTDGSCSAQVLEWSGSMDQDVINVFVVHGIQSVEGPVIADDENAAGVTLPNSRILCGGNNQAIVLLTYGCYGANFANTAGTPRVTAHDLAHEIGHLIIYYSAQLTGTYDAGGHSTTPDLLMNSSDQDYSFDWDALDDALINNHQNPMSSLFFPEGGTP